MIRETIMLAEIYNRDLCLKIRNAIYNKFMVKTFYESTQTSDCNMLYAVKIDDKITFKKRQQIAMYVQGFIDCWKSFS